GGAPLRSRRASAVERERRAPAATETRTGSAWASGLFGPAVHRAASVPEARSAWPGHLRSCGRRRPGGPAYACRLGPPGGRDAAYVETVPTLRKPALGAPLSGRPALPCSSPASAGFCTYWCTHRRYRSGQADVKVRVRRWFVLSSDRPSGGAGE